MEKILKIICLTSYSLIILKGDLIGLPFLYWLVWTSFESSNNDQIFAVLGLIGFIMMFTKFHKRRIFRVLIVVLMITPILRRLMAVNFEKFNYLTFIIPFSIFILSSLILTIIPITDEKSGTRRYQNNRR